VDTGGFTVKKQMTIALLGLGLLGAQSAFADDDLWFGAKAGTLGFGLEATWRPVPYLDVRGGFNSYTYDSSAVEAGIDYDTSLNLDTFYATANLRPPMSPFRITAGLFSNSNELSMASQASGTYDIGGMTYTAAEVGTINNVIGFDSTAPYLGFGADFRLANTIGLNIDVGVLWQGEPIVGMSVTGPIGQDPSFQAELDAETAALQSALDNFKAYPVASIGVSVNF
jgi:hypothetical protein